MWICLAFGTPPKTLFRRKNRIVEHVFFRRCVRISCICSCTKLPSSSRSFSHHRNTAWTSFDLNFVEGFLQEPRQFLSTSWLRFVSLDRKVFWMKESFLDKMVICQTSSLQSLASSKDSIISTHIYKLCSKGKHNSLNKHI